MPRHTESSSISTAVRVVEARVKASAAYIAARDLAEWIAFREYMGCASSDDLRARGGRSAMAVDAVTRALAECPEAHEEMGSRLWPCTPASLLRRDVAAEVQRPAYQREMRERVVLETAS